MSTVWRGFVALALVVMLLAAGGILGYGMGFSHYQPRILSLEQQLQERQAELADTKLDLSQAQARLDQATQSLRQTQDAANRTALGLDQARAQLDSARVQADKMAGDLGATLLQLDARELQLTALLAREQQWDKLRQTIDQMRNDRQLLAELRKQTPDTRDENIAYWESIRRLAAQSDPRLAPKVDQVIAASRTYFNWLASPYRTEEEQSNAFFLTGAYLLSDVTTDFLNSVFLVVATRMDAALQQAQALG